MKKILSWLIIFILMASPTWSWAENCVAQSGGVDLNWSTEGNWTGCTGIPAADDNVDLAAINLVWDVATIPASGSLGAITASDGGTLTLDMDAVCDSNCALTATTITAGANSGAGTIILNGAADTDNEVTITASGTGGITGGSTPGDVAVYMNAKGILNTDANITGGAGGLATGIIVNDGKINVEGTSKKVKGGAGSYGISITATCDGGTITADVEGADSSSKAGFDNSKSGITLTGNLINKGAMAWQGMAPTWNPKAATPDSYISMTADSTANTKFYSDIPDKTNVLPADTVAGDTGEAVSSSGGAWGF
jgi:subtilase-type serine protease